MTMMSEADPPPAAWRSRSMAAAVHMPPHSASKRTPAPETSESPVRRKYSVLDKLSPIEIGPKPLPKNAWKNVSSSGTIPSQGIGGSVGGFLRGMSAGARATRSVSVAGGTDPQRPDASVRPHTAAPTQGGALDGPGTLRGSPVSPRAASAVPRDHIDPDLIEDRLPQPYRMIDKLLTSFLEDVWATIERNEEARRTRMQAVSTRRVTTCDNVRGLANTAQVTCVVTTADDRFMFVGTRRGTVLVLNPRQWFSTVASSIVDGHSSVAVLQVESIGDGAYLLGVGMKEDGSVRLYGFAESVLVPLHNFDGAHPSFRIASDGDMVALAGADGLVTLYQLPAKIWAQRVLSTGGEDRAGTPTRSHTSLAVNTNSERRSVNQPTLLMRIAAPPEPPLSRAYLSTRAADRTTGHDVHTPAAAGQKKLGAPTVHFVKEPVRFGASLTSRDAAQLVNASACVWWTGSIQVHKYALHKRTYGPKELAAPETAWVHPQVIRCSAASDCGTLLATGLRNGMIVIWDCVLGVKRSITGSVLGTRICDLTFCGSAVLLAGMSDGVSLILDTRSSKATTCTPPDEDADAADGNGVWPGQQADNTRTPVLAVIPMPRERMFVSMQRTVGHAYDFQTGRCLGVISLAKEGQHSVCDGPEAIGSGLGACFVDESLVFRGRLSVHDGPKPPEGAPPPVPLFDPTPSLAAVDLLPILQGRRIGSSTFSLFTPSQSDRSALDASEVRVFTHLERRATAKNDRRRGQRQRDLAARVGDIAEVGTLSGHATPPHNSAPGHPAVMLSVTVHSPAIHVGKPPSSAPPSRPTSPGAGPTGATLGGMLAPPKTGSLRPGSGKGR